MGEPLLTYHQAAAYLEITGPELEEAMAAKRIRYYLDQPCRGRGFLFSREDLEEYMRGLVVETLERR